MKYNKRKLRAVMNENQIELVWVNRVYSKNFVTDFFQNMKNIIGGRLKAYEGMMNDAIEDCWKEFKQRYPEAKNLKVDTEQLVHGTVMVTITGETYNEFN